MAWEFLHPTLSFNLAKPSRKAITSIFISSACLLTTPVPPVTADLGPLGNVGAALQAISSNSDSLFCNLDNFNIKEGQSSCQQLDSVVRYKGGKLLTIRQDWGGSASTGAAVWNGANMATWYLENTIGANNVQDKSVLELGAGVGFTSLVANAMGARDVVSVVSAMTDVSLQRSERATRVKENRAAHARARLDHASGTTGA